MRHFKVTFLSLAVALTLSGCALFGGSDGTDVAVAESVEAQPTVNSVQAVPASTVAPTAAAVAAPADTSDSAPADTSDGATAALPTAVTLPTAAPTPEPTVDRSQPTTYIVQSGDVLGVIAERLDADIAELRRINNLDGNLIRVGQELTIPALDGSTETADAAPAATSAPSSSGSASTASVSCNSAATGHCVQPGESLLGIALKYDISVDALRAANPGISGDLIRSGQVLNLSGNASASTATTTTTTTTTTGSSAAEPAPTVGPINDAECAARNREFPYFHASDGLCYANPFNATAVPAAEAAAANGNADNTCDPGFFLWEDGLCYPIPGATVEATPGPTPTNPPVDPIYGRPPCRDGYVEIVATNVCWPEPDTTPTTPTPAPTSDASTTECVDPYFVESAGRCFVTDPQGAAKGCTVVDNKPSCPSA